MVTFSEADRIRWFLKISEQVAAPEAAHLGPQLSQLAADMQLVTGRMAVSPLQFGTVPGVGVTLPEFQNGPFPGWPSSASPKPGLRDQAGG
jgi:hypothetical protein